MSRKTAETNANSEVILYSYSASGDLLTLTDGKNQVTTWQYDKYCRQTKKLDATSTSVFQYKYDANGRLTNRWTPAKGHTYYAFDSVGRLLSEDGPWADDTVSYGYHTNGLRSSLSVEQPTVGGVPWTQVYGYDVANRLTNITSGAGTFYYQYQTTVGGNSTPAGSLIYKTLLPGGSETVNTHDGNGRLVSTALKNSFGTTLNSHSYIYNVGNQRTKQTFTDGNYTAGLSLIANLSPPPHNP